MFLLLTHEPSADSSGSCCEEEPPGPDDTPLGQGCKLERRLLLLAAVEGTAAVTVAVAVSTPTPPAPPTAASRADCRAAVTLSSGDSCDRLLRWTWWCCCPSSACAGGTAGGGGWGDISTLLCPLYTCCCCCCCACHCCCLCWRPDREASRLDSVVMVGSTCSCWGLCTCASSTLAFSWCTCGRQTATRGWVGWAVRGRPACVCVQTTAATHTPIP